MAGSRYTLRNARLLFKLPAFLRHPLTGAECRRIVQWRLRRRPQDFLRLLEATVFGNPDSPYRALLNLAGCEPGDIRQLVEQEGLESALEALFHAGVYLTTDEYKGRCAVIRGSARIEASPRRLQNPLTAPEFYAQTSGSRGIPTSIPLALAGIRDRAVNMALTLDARGGFDWRKAIWEMSGIGPLLWYSAAGKPVERWFAKADLDSPDLSRSQAWKLRAETTLLTWTSRRSGRPLPRREYVPPTKPLPIVRWLEKTLAERQVPHLWMSASSAVRVCEEAERAGVSIEGAQFTVTGEPVTSARMAVMARAGVTAVPDYGSADSGGSVGGGCGAPGAPDDVHLFSDLNAVIQPEAPGLPEGALVLTSLRATTPYIFINLVTGDRAVMNERHCGCPLEGFGWRTHLREIRSFDKLTAGGMTFMDTDVIRILEEILPERFGGGPSDYQLVEDIEADGHPRLRLLVHPKIGRCDEQRVIAAFLDALAAGSTAERLMANQLRKEHILAVARRAPLATSSGKILHVWAGEEPVKGKAE